MASGKKNYFRHLFNARNDDKIQDLMDRFGLAGYFYFFALLELQASNCSDEYNEICVYHQRTLIKELRLHKNKLKVFLEYSASISILNYTYTENRVEVSIPNLSKYMGKYTNKSDPNLPNKRKEKKRKEKEKTEPVKHSVKSKFDIDAIYSAYPKKVGKAAGVKKLQTIIKTDETYNKVMQGVINYGKHCKEENTDIKYIKQFSTFVNGEHWEDEYLSQYENQENKTIELQNEVEALLNRGF
jgi:hypothetical protein